MKSDVRRLFPARFSSVMLGMCENRFTFGASKFASCISTTSNACRFAKSAGVKRERSAPVRLKARSLLAILACRACHGTGFIESTSAPELGELWLVTNPVCGFTHCAGSTRHCASVMSAYRSYRMSETGKTVSMGARSPVQPPAKSLGMCPNCRMSSFHTTSFRPHGSMPSASGGLNLVPARLKSGRGVSMAAMIAARSAAWLAVSRGS